MWDQAPAIVGMIISIILAYLLARKNHKVKVVVPEPLDPGLFEETEPEPPPPIDHTAFDHDAHIPTPDPPASGASLNERVRIFRESTDALDEGM